jgi:putative protein-disulfide isomerase
LTEITPAEMPRPRLLLFADTMCSWCYGFAPEMQLVLSSLGGEIDLLLFAGGLRPFTKEAMPPDLRAKLQGAYQRIGELTGQPFAPAWQGDENFVYDTEPAARAVVTIRHLSPGEEYPFMGAIQRAFYAEGEDITKPDVLAKHAEAFGIKRETFLESFDSETMRATTLGDFKLAQQFGIDGFPTLVLHKKDAAGEDRFVLISQGYAKAPMVLERTRTALAA